MSMDDILQELQREYVDSIPSKIIEIQNFLQQKDLENLINSFHKIKGSGKTYGVEEMSLLGQFYEHWMREDGDKVFPFVARAIDFLNKIYQTRQQKKPYPLDQDAEFLKLQKIKST